MLLSLAVNLPCGEPTCPKHEVIRRYIHLGTAGGPTAVQALRHWPCKTQTGKRLQNPIRVHKGEIKGGRMMEKEFNKEMGHS